MKKVLIIILLFSAYSCKNHLEKSGAIAIYGSKSEIYEEIMVELKIPNSITGKIYMIRWEITPANAASIQYEKNIANDFSFKNDRKAVIVAVKRGNIVLRALAKEKNGKKEYIIAEKKVTIK